MPRFFVKCVEMRLAAKSSLIVVPQGAKDPREQNVAVLRRTKGGSTISVPIGDKVIPVGAKLQVKATKDGVMLLPR